MEKKENIKKSLKEWKDDYLKSTTKVSDLTRYLSIVGIGIIWIMSNGLIINPLFLSIKLFIISLTLDFTQYLWKSINTGILYNIKEIKYNNNKITDSDIEDVQIWNYVPIFTWIFFLSKIVFMIMGYIKIYNFIFM